MIHGKVSQFEKRRFNILFHTIKVRLEDLEGLISFFRRGKNDDKLHNTILNFCKYWKRQQQLILHQNMGNLWTFYIKIDTVNSVENN